MVIRFQAALRHALATSGSATLERWLSDGQVRDAIIVETDGTTERIPFAPDALFTLRLVNEPEGRNRVHIFLEADRGTMTTTRFLTKLRGYWHWWRSGQQERLGIRNFRVLTVTRSVERADSLCGVAEGIDPPQHRGLGMFLCGSEITYTKEESTMQILDAVWRTPADTVLQGLLE